MKVAVSRNPLQDVEQLLCSLCCTCYECCVVSVHEVVERLILAVQPGEKLTAGCEFLAHVVHEL